MTIFVSLLSHATLTMRAIKHSLFLTRLRRYKQPSIIACI
uniref:Uncharacterized protein n=1 Tax=Arundo donax TaxID=35708 RepID=A0A0A9BF72_ARUDO